MSERRLPGKPDSGDARAKRVVFVNRYFYPDHSATSQILSDLAFHLAARGVKVVVITTRQTYTDAGACLPARERIAGVDVVRLKTTAFGRMQLLGRTIDYASFYFTAFAALFRMLKSDDIVVTKTDPPLMSVLSTVAAQFRGAHRVNWLQDLFPEVAVALRPDLVKGSIAVLAKAARDWSLREAAMNVVLGRHMHDRVRLLGVPRERIVIIPNWADDRSIVPVAHDRNPLRREWGLEGRFVVAYSGNFGRAHEFRTILEAARRLRDRSDVVFLFVGGGARAEQVKQFIAEHALTNVIERPYQPRERLQFSLAAGDLHLVSLIPELEGLIVPSKFYGIAAAQRPTAFIGEPLLSELGELLHKHRCGKSFALGDAAGLADFILELAGDPGKCEEMGRNARRALDIEWSQEKAFARWEQTLRAIGQPAGCRDDLQPVLAAGTRRNRHS